MTAHLQQLEWALAHVALNALFERKFYGAVFAPVSAYSALHAATIQGGANRDYVFFAFLFENETDGARFF